MKLRSPIFAALAAVYEESQAGRTGRGERDVQPSFAELCERADLREGDPYELAVTELRKIDGTLVKLEWDHPRAKTTIHKVRLSPRQEADFYAALECESPTERRRSWVALFMRASEWPVSAAYAAEWASFCASRADRAEHWEQMEPFRVRKHIEGEVLLEVTAKLLGWEGRNLIRWVSSHLCGDSKRLERRAGSLEQLLRESSGGRIASLESHGILPMPREARVAGPLRLRIGGEWLDCGALEVATLSLADLQGAEAVECAATRCLTVENKTVFLDLAAKRSGEMLIWTSFPNAATIELLQLLPRTMEFWHFGDTDPSGFDILRDLSERTQLIFRPFRMQVRTAPASRLFSPGERGLLGKLLASPHLDESRGEIERLLEAGVVGAFEQEEHQPAPLAHWPFYPEEPRTQNAALGRP